MTGSRLLISRLATGSPLPRAPAGNRRQLAQQWRSLGRAATLVAVLTSPAAFVWFHKHQGWSIGWSIAGDDHRHRRRVPRPRRPRPAPASSRGRASSGTDDARLREEDVVNRRRAWFWRFWCRLVGSSSSRDHARLVIRSDPAARATSRWLGDADAASSTGSAQSGDARSSCDAARLRRLPLHRQLPDLHGPDVLMGISQIRGFEPGDADWGVKLDDVRGQAEAKEEVRRIVHALAVGRALRGRGRQARARRPLPRRARDRQDDAREGDRDRVQLAVRDDPGLRASRRRSSASTCSSSASSRARRRSSPRKWGGQCIVFIDEIDAVGDAPPGARQATTTPASRACTTSSSTARTARSTRRGDMVLETRAWRERLFDAARARAARRRPGWCSSVGSDRQPGVFPAGCWAAAGPARAQPAADRHGRRRQPAVHAPRPTNKINTLLDASTSSRGAIGTLSLRLPPPRPRKEQIYFIGATNVPLERARPGADAPGPHGPPRLVPDADEAGPPRHLRPLPRQGRARAGSRHGRSAATRSRGSRTATRRR